MKNDSTLPERLREFHRLSFSLISLSEKGQVIGDYFEDASNRLIDFTGAELVSIVARGERRFFRFRFSNQKGRELTKLARFPEPAIEKAALDSLPGLPGLFTDISAVNVLESLVFSGSVQDSGFATKSGGLNINCNFPPDLSTAYRSILVLPIRFQDEVVGTVAMGWRSGYLPDDLEVELYQFIVDIIGFSRSHRQAKFMLGERIKELETIYRISRLGSEPGKTLEDIMQGAVNFIPFGFLHPDYTCCKIVYLNQTFTGSNNKLPVYTIREEIFVESEPKGHVEVGYLRKSSSIYKVPFLKEEQSMLKAVAGELGHIAARKHNELEKERLQQQLLHADRLVTVGQLTAGIAHELNEPLGGILGFAQLIKKYGRINNTVEKDIEKIIKAALHGREIIRKLMLFSRQAPPEKVMVDINERIDDGLYLLENRINKSRIKLIKDYASNLPLIKLDPAQLNQVLVNLVVNAIQAMPEGGEITLKTASTIDDILIIIKDTGAGIALSDLENIFLPFYTTKGPSEGAGLGLPVALGIVQSHRGTITVDSEPGKGTAFTVKFPIGGDYEDGKKKQG